MDFAYPVIIIIIINPVNMQEFFYPSNFMTPRCICFLLLLKARLHRLCCLVTNWWIFLFYSTHLLFSSSFNSWDIPLIQIFFTCNKEADDASSTHKLLIKKKKKETNQGNYSLFTFGANCSCGLHCLPALVYLLVRPINFTLLIYWIPICFHWSSSHFCCPSIVEHWCRNMYSIVDQLVQILRTVPYPKKI